MQVHGFFTPQPPSHILREIHRRTSSDAALLLSLSIDEIDLRTAVFSATCTNMGRMHLHCVCVCVLVSRVLVLAKVQKGAGERTLDFERE